MIFFLISFILFVRESLAVVNTFLLIKERKLKKINLTARMQLVLEGKVPDTGTWGQYRSQAEEFICSCTQKGTKNVKKTPGGLLWFLEWDGLQYVATASLVAATYGNYLSANHASIHCAGVTVQPTDLFHLAQSQV